MSYGNMDNVASQVSGSSSVLAADWNTYVRDNFDDVKAGHVCLSTVDRVALGTPVTGTMVFDSTLNVLMLWNGSAWINLSNSGSVSGGGFLTGAVTFSGGGPTLFGRAELRATFVKRNTASSVLATMHLTGALFNSGVQQSFNASMYNPTSGHAGLANLFAPSTGTYYNFGGSGVIWSGLAAGSYTVEPSFRDYSASSVVIFGGGGGSYNTVSSSVVYSLLEIN